LGPDGTLGRADTKEAVLTRDLRAALNRLNPQLSSAAVTEAVQTMTCHDYQVYRPASSVALRSYRPDNF
jgi:hypothetical protein